QRDPLIEYQREGYDMFATMMDGIKEESVLNLFNLPIPTDPIMAQADGDGSAALGVAQRPQAQAQLPQAQAQPPQAPARKQRQARQPAETGAAASAEDQALPAGLARGLARPQRSGNLSYTAPSDDGMGHAQQKTSTATAYDPMFANVG